MKKWTWLSTFFLLALTGCAAKVNDGILPVQPQTTVGGQFPKPWVLYDDYLKTGGGYFFYPGVPPTQSVNVADTNNPYDGRASFNYIVTDFTGSNFCGVIFSNTPSYVNYGTASTPGPNLSAEGFTKVAFWARANQLANINMGGGQGSNGAVAPVTPLLSLTTNWQSYSVSLPVTLTDVQGFFTIGVANNDGPGNAMLTLPFQVNIDDLQYQ